MRSLRIVLVTLMSLTACEQLGVPDPAKEKAALEAEGKAVGAACRHAGRPIEDCYTLNPKAIKSAVFAGWKEMNDYMTENKIEEAQPKLTEQAQENAAAEAEAAKKPAKLPKSSGFPPPEPIIRPRESGDAADAAEPVGDKKGEHATDKPADKAADKASDKAGDKAGDKAADKKPAKAASQ